MKFSRIWTMAVLCLVLLVAGAGLAAAAPHPAVDMKQAGGAIAAPTTPYSPKMSCGATGTCHIGGVATTGGHNYGSMPASVTHTQGVLESDGKVYWQSYDVSFFDHGVSKGRHSNQGRNEAYNTTMRIKFGDPFFTSSPGMFGKY